MCASCARVELNQYLVAVACFTVALIYACIATAATAVQAHQKLIMMVLLVGAAEFEGLLFARVR
jgi:hypothetical protein